MNTFPVFDGPSFDEIIQSLKDKDSPVTINWKDADGEPQSVAMVVDSIIATYDEENVPGTKGTLWILEGNAAEVNKGGYMHLFYNSDTLTGSVRFKDVSGGDSGDTPPEPFPRGSRD